MTTKETDVEAPAASPRSRRRIIIRSVIVAFVVVFAWIGVLVGFQMLKSEPYNFRKEVEVTMFAIRDVRADELYDTASPRTRRAMTQASFIERAERVNTTLGQFQKVLGTDGAVINDKPQGRTGYVRASLEFSRGTTTGSFSFHWDDEEKRWQLFGYYVEIPPDLVADSEQTEAARARSEAPAEVIALAKQIFIDLSNHKVREVYDAAHPEFKTTHAFEQFEARFHIRQREMGSFVHILDLTTTGKNESDSKAWVTAVLEYSKAQTTGTLDFWNTDGTWRLRKFHITIPEPQVPRRPAPREAPPPRPTDAGIPADGP